MIRYVPPPPGTLRRVPLDIMTAIYDRRSTQTHLVAAPVPAILDAIEAGAGDLAGVADRIDWPPGEEAALAGHLDALTAVGLVERR